MADDGKLGAFITEIRKGGPADRQAQLQIGIYWITLCAAMSLTPLFFFFLENTPLVKFIRNYIRDWSGIFSTSLARILMTSFLAFSRLVKTTFCSLAALVRKICQLCNAFEWYTVKYHMYYSSFLGIHTSLQVSVYTKREMRCITILHHAIENKVANTIPATNVRRMMGSVIPLFNH